MLRSAPPSPLKGPVHQDGGRRGRIVPHGFLLPSPSCEEHSVASEEPHFCRRMSSHPNKTGKTPSKLFEPFTGLTFIMHFSNVCISSRTTGEKSHTSHFQFLSSPIEDKLKFGCHRSSICSMKLNRNKDENRCLFQKSN